jgi:hypothetical protein
VRHGFRISRGGRRDASRYCQDVRRGDQYDFEAMKGQAGQWSRKHSFRRSWAARNTHPARRYRKRCRRGKRLPTTTSDTRCALKTGRGASAGGLGRRTRCLPISRHASADGLASHTTARSPNKTLALSRTAPFSTKWDDQRMVGHRAHRHANQIRPRTNSIPTIISAVTNATSRAIWGL